MKFSQVAALPLLFSSATLAAPPPTLQERATTSCDQWGTIVSGPYTLYQDLWNEASATSGSQCSTLNSLTNGVVSWSTSWTWVGASSQVKSYANIALTTTGVQLKSITSMPSVWKWGYTGTSIVADVAYDFFTSSTASGSNEFEIMIWVAAIGGAGPISSTGSAIATVTIAGVSWKLYSGPNGSTTVYSFVAVTQATNFSGDMLEFFNYLVAHEGFSTSQYITTAEAGTEPFTGTSAVLTVSAYSFSIVTGGTVATTSTSTKATSTTAVKTTSTSTVAATTTTAASSGGSIAKYFQCGGIGWTGSGTCVSGTTCTAQNAYYSQCL
jgi:xyloglucan-specific endo-beta-1,4-glucanase